MPWDGKNLDEGQVACANIMGPTRSLNLWQGEHSEGGAGMLIGKVLFLAGAAALLPPIAGQVFAQAPAASLRPFAPPDSPLVLTRTVWRTLADGKEIVVRRRYAVQFSRYGEGFLLEGRLLDAAVEAPPMLAAMAELERKRGDDSLFPLLLDAAGRIRHDASARLASPALRDTARAQANGVIAEAPLGPAQQQESGIFLKQLAMQGAPTAWPVDLFNPTTGERSERRRLALPGGQEGEVLVSVKVVSANPDGLPRAVERTVTTVLAGSARTSREQWTLAQADRPAS